MTYVIVVTNNDDDIVSVVDAGHYPKSVIDDINAATRDLNCEAHPLESLESFIDRHLYEP